MPDVRSDIRVAITPYVAAVDQTKLRQQVEDIFKNPIKIKIETGDITKKVASSYRTIQKQAEAAVKQLAANKALFDKWNTNAESYNVTALGRFNPKLSGAFSKASTLIDSIGKGNADLITKDQWPQVIDYIKQYQHELAKARAARSAFNAGNQVDINFNHLTSQAQDYFARYQSGITKNADLSRKWGEYLNKLKVPSSFGGGVTEARKEFTQLTQESREAGAEIETAGQKLNNLFGKHLATAAVMVAINALRRGIQGVYQNVKELDAAMVDLQISSGKTRVELRSLMTEYSSFARELGATTVEVTQAADSWLRQGYELSDVETLIRDSMMLSKLGKIDSAEATKALTSTMKGYKIAVSDASTIVDKFSTVDMNAAVSAGELATAMAECAVGADLSGISIDRLTGYLARVLETTQDGAESVGVFFKTLIARMSNIKSGKLVDPETQEDLSDVERVLKNNGITLRDNADQFRNFGDILDEVAAKWKTWSNVTQAAVAVAFSGTRNQEKFKVLMEGYDEALGYADIAANSTGNATQKYAAYLEGVEAHLNKLTAAFEKLSQTILSSDLVTRGIDFLTTVVDALQSIFNITSKLQLGSLIPLATVIGGIRGAQGKGRFQMVNLVADMPLYILVVTRNELAA